MHERVSVAATNLMPDLPHPRAELLHLQIPQASGGGDVDLGDGHHEGAHIVRHEVFEHADLRVLADGDDEPREHGDTVASDHVANLDGSVDDDTSRDSEHERGGDERVVQIGERIDRLARDGAKQVGPVGVVCEGTERHALCNRSGIERGLGDKARFGGHRELLEVECVDAAVAPYLLCLARKLAGGQAFGRRGAPRHEPGGAGQTGGSVSGEGMHQGRVTGAGNRPPNGASYRVNVPTAQAATRPPTRIAPASACTEIRQARPISSPWRMVMSGAVAQS